MNKPPEAGCVEVRVKFSPYPTFVLALNYKIYVLRTMSEV